MTKIKKKKMRHQVKEGIRVAAWVATIFTVFFAFWTIHEVRQSVLRTQPDLRVNWFSAFLMENGEGSSEGEDSIYLKYHHEENIEYLKIDIKIVNIGSGIAYDLDVYLSLPGLKFSQITGGYGVRGYVGGTQVFEISSWSNTFLFGSIILSPQGGSETLRLRIPFERIGSIDNLPESCIMTIKDITKTTLLEKIVDFYYIQY